MSQATEIIILPDLHFGLRSESATEISHGPKSEEEAKKEAWKLVENIRHDKDFSYQPTALICVGDVTNQAGQSGFDLAASFFAVLKATFPSTAFLFTPGNHDVLHTGSTTPQFYSLIRSKEANLRFQQFTELIGERSDFSQPALDMIGTNPRIGLLRLNSSRIERPACLGLGYVGMDQMMLILEEQYEELKRHPFPIIAYTHFNLLPAHLSATVDNRFADTFRRSRKASLSYLIDQAEVLAFLNELHVSLVIHGHSHQEPIVHKVSGFHFPHFAGSIKRDGNPSMHVLDAGAFLHPRLNCTFRTYLSARIEGAVITLKRIRYGDKHADLTRIEGWSGPVPLLPNANLTQANVQFYENDLLEFFRARGLAEEAAAAYIGWSDFFRFKKNQTMWDDYLDQLAKRISDSARIRFGTMCDFKLVRGWLAEQADSRTEPESDFKEFELDPFRCFMEHFRSQRPDLV